MKTHGKWEESYFCLIIAVKKFNCALEKHVSEKVKITHPLAGG